MSSVVDEIRLEALKDGVKEGVNRSKKEVALRMLRAGKYETEEISVISGLTLEEVLALQGDKTA